MVETKPSDQSERQSHQPVEKPALNSPEGQQVRNASGDQVEAIRASNPDKSDGSATPKNKAGRYTQALLDGQDKSLELFDEDRLVAARVMEVAKPIATARELIEQQSKTVEELTRIAKVNPVYEPILALRQHAEGLAPGQEKDKFVQLSKDQLAETKGQFREPESQSEDQESCGSHAYEPQPKAITIGQNSYCPDSLVAYDNRQSLVSDATNARVAKNIPFDELDKRPIRDYEYQVTEQEKDKVKALETGVAYEVGRQQVAEQAVFERVAALPLHQQALVLHAGIQAYRQELDHQQFRIAVGEITGLGESVVGVARGADSLGKSICDVAQFSQDIAENNPRAQETAAQAGQSFGKLLVGGFKVIAVADNYLGSVGAATVDGDNTKAFRDISALGQKMNERWQAMSPEEKARIATKATIDNLGPIAAAGTGAKLARSMDIAGALQELGAGARVLGAKEREKYSNVIAGIWDECRPQPMGLTTDGRLMPIPRDRLKTDGNMLMSKADDLEGKPLPGKGGASEPLHDREIVNPIDRTASVEQKIAQLEALSRENKPLVEAFLGKIDAEFGTKSEISFKAAKDIADKAKRPSIKDAKDWFDVEHVRDAFRFKTPVDSLSELPKIVAALKASGFEIVKPDLDRLLNPKGRGWRMAAFDLRAPNGQIVEYQILSKEMNEAGKIEHSTYKALREKDVNKMTRAELDNKDKADIEAGRLYRSAQEDYQKRTGQDRQAIEQIIKDTEEVISKGVK